MAKVLLTYDVKETSKTIHTELKKYLIDHYSFSQRILATNNSKYYDLPNTTLMKDNTSADQAGKDFINACSAVGAIWEKYIVSDYTYSSFDTQNV